MPYALIQQQIYAGFGFAAAQTGQSYQLYRPSSATNPLDPANLQFSIMAAFATEPTYKFEQPPQYGKPQRYPLVDGTQTQVNDYLTDGVNTWFISNMPPLMPIEAVSCNRVISVSRPASTSGVGLLPYDGELSDTPVMANWPASVLQGTRGEKGDANLPGDVKLPWFTILLPAVPGVQIKAFDVATDDAGQRYRIASTELSNLGWRLTAGLSQT